MTLDQVRDIYDVFSVRVREDNFCDEYTFDVAYYAHEILKCTERMENETDAWRKSVFEERIDMAMKNLEKLMCLS